MRRDGTLRAHGPGLSDPYAYWCQGSGEPVPGVTPAPGRERREPTFDWFEDVRER